MSIAAMNAALEFVERICGDLCNAEYNPCEARDIADTLRAAIEAAQTVAKCDHIPVTTFGGDFCIKCNEPMDSNEYPKPAPAWQPIETAPRDGTEILAYTKYESFYVVAYDDAFRTPWVIRNNEGLMDRTITHWMPLPAAPKETK